MENRILLIIVYILFGVFLCEFIHGLKMRRLVKDLDNWSLRSKLDDEIVIKAFQEIACDYRVRVIGSGYGMINMDIINMKIYNGECLLNEDSSPLNIEFDDDGDLFIIMFRLYGKTYAGFAKNEKLAWAAVAREARKESKALFAKVKYIPR